MAKKKLFILIGLLLFLGTSFFTIAQITEKMPDANETASGASLPPLKSPSLVVKKKARRLFLYDDKKLIKTYNIALGFAPEGDKETEGDGKTPEGEFYIFTKNPKSQFYLSLGLSYPNTEAAERGLKAKLITRAEYNAIIKAVREKKMPPQKTALGGEIYIHGGGTSDDWTWGCAALRNEEIKELFDALPIGTTVIITP